MRSLNLLGRFSAKLLVHEIISAVVRSVAICLEMLVISENSLLIYLWRLCIVLTYSRRHQSVEVFSFYTLSSVFTKVWICTGKLASSSSGSGLGNNTGGGTGSISNAINAPIECDMHEQKDKRRNYGTCLIAYGATGDELNKNAKFAVLSSSASSNAIW